jgi:simple sugar transport system ATP-binding protein
LGRELALDNPFLLLDQPTRGLDVGSIEYVHETIVAASERGRAVLLISADLEELFRLSDRILVLYRGRIVADLRVGATSIEEVGRYMLEGAAK